MFVFISVYTRVCKYMRTHVYMSMFVYTNLPTPPIYLLTNPSPTYIYQSMNVAVYSCLRVFRVHRVPVLRFMRKGIECIRNIIPGTYLFADLLRYISPGPIY